MTARRALLLVVSAIAAVAAALPAAAAADGLYPTAAQYPGLQHLTYKFGPIDVAPGQNTIEIRNNDLKPPVPGYITSFKPNLTYLNGKVPGVDVIHLHHGVWLVDGNPTWAAGEEKTNVFLPQGYGYAYDPSQAWHLNYMVHNLTPNPDRVYLTYEIDFLPADAAAAQEMKSVRTQWMDVSGLKAYPVFDALRRNGQGGEYTFPTMATGAERSKIGAAHSWTVAKAGTLVATAGHLHPGGLHTDLYLTRNGQRVRLFRSDAHYFEPAGAVSWDVAMTNTPADWRVQLQPGDVVEVTGTYDVSKASWYESMAIMPIAYSEGDTTGVDPFSGQLNTRGVLNHGHLAENDNHGGAADVSYLNALDQPSEPAKAEIPIEGYIYGQGDMLAGDAIPTIAPGGTITFDNIDAPLNNGVWHTITSCKAPCNQSTGIAYPLADADIPFDSGQLGAVGPPTAGRVTWSTPTDLPDGTYTYFCRIHPAMRGAFRVADEP
jgi:plastocyanin